MRSPKLLALVHAGAAREAFPERGPDANANSAPIVTHLVKEADPMPTKARHTLISMIFALAAAFGSGGSVKADQPPDLNGQMIVESVWATPATAGAWSILRLRIINESHDHAHLVGVDTPVAETARIVGKISDHETTTFESISARADSELDLTSEHMWIELGPLTRAVKSGELIPLELVFVRGRVRAEAHVHSADG